MSVTNGSSMYRGEERLAQEDREEEKEGNEGVKERWAGGREVYKCGYGEWRKLVLS